MIRHPVIFLKDFADACQGVRHRAEDLRLCPDDVKRCADHTAALIRRGEPSGQARVEGLRLARWLASMRSNLSGGAA